MILLTHLAARVFVTVYVATITNDDARCVIATAFFSAFWALKAE